MKITGYFNDKNELIASSDTTEFISELLKNKEYIDFHDKHELFDLIIKSFEQQQNKIIKLESELQKTNELLNDKINSYIISNIKHKYFLEVGIIFILIVLLFILYKIL